MSANVLVGRLGGLPTAAPIVVNKGSVSLTDAIAGGDVPGRLVEDPPKVTDFDPDFVPAAG